MKQVVLISLIVIICLISILGLLNIIAHVNKTWQKGRVIESQVIAVSGNMLLLADGKIVQLAGAYIPVSGSNYRKELVENLKHKVLNKNAKVEVITFPKAAYPKFPIVKVYVNKSEINKSLLEGGMAFFDHGYYKGKNRYHEMQQKAQKEKIGIWGDENPPKALFEARKKWEGIHFIECPTLKDVPKAEQEYYYFAPQFIHYFKYLELDDCPNCGSTKPALEDSADYNIDLAAQHLKEIAQKLNQNK